MGILYGSTPTIISLRLESGGQRGPRALTGTQCKVLCPESLCGPPPITGIMSLVHLELWDFSRIPGATIARGILLSPFELSVMQLRVLFLSRCLFESVSAAVRENMEMSRRLSSGIFHETPMELPQLECQHPVCYSSSRFTSLAPWEISLNVGSAAGRNSNGGLNHGRKESFVERQIAIDFCELFLEARFFSRRT